MTVRPILFAAPMVRAIISGAKTQTRRVIMSIGADKLCPYGAPGDRLWVRETFAEFPAPGDFIYRADFEEPLADRLKWEPSSRMPHRASRLTLAVTGVRVERLQEITEADARAEGISRVPFRPDDGFPICDGYMVGQDDGVSTLGPTARGVFEGLWESINGKRPRCSWGDNPWVWVVEFQRAEVTP